MIKTASSALGLVLAGLLVAAPGSALAATVTVGTDVTSTVDTGGASAKGTIDFDSTQDPMPHAVGGPAPIQGNPPLLPCTSPPCFESQTEAGATVSAEGDAPGVEAHAGADASVTPNVAGRIWHSVVNFFANAFISFGFF
jgi:hypothetical protein